MNNSELSESKSAVGHKPEAPVQMLNSSFSGFSRSLRGISITVASIVFSIILIAIVQAMSYLQSPMLCTP